MTDEEVLTVTETSEGEQAAAETTEEVIVEVVVIPEDRPFLTTALNDYSVSEGLLLLILIVLLLRGLANLIKEGFYWLW